LIRTVIFKKPTYLTVALAPVQGHSFAAGDLGLEQKVFSQQPGEENKQIYRKKALNIASVRMGSKQINMR
jgi:hypothetical protein